MLMYFGAEAQCITTSSSSVSISASTNSAISSDDATEVGGNVSTNMPNLQLGARYIGLRFPSVAIPKSATITGAYIQFTSSSNSTADISDVAIKGHNVGNSGTFTAATGSNELSTRYNSAGTNAIVYWGNGADWSSGEAGPNQRTNDLKAIVQEIIDRPDWNPANPITLLINATSSGTGPVAQSSENIGAASPRLIITYQQITTIGLTATVSGCYNTTAGSRATVSVEVNWTNAPPNENILVTLNGQTRTILPGLNVLNFYDPDGYSTPASVEIASPQIIAFEVPADGASGPITATFQTNTTCSASGSYTAPPACLPLTCTPGTDLSGIAFNDFNADGIHNASETAGVPGITVIAFDCAGTTFSTVTNANGQYKLTIPLANYPVRVEFSNLPAGYTAQGTPNNVDGRTTVQFVNAPDCSIDLGMLNPANYCQANPKVFVPRYVNGNPLGGGTAGSLSAFLSSNDVDSSSFTPGSPGSGLYTSTAPPVQMVAASQVGALWGVAYNRQTGTIFSSAVLRRHAGLGTLGLGGIYTINPATNAVSNFLNVSTIGINVGSVGSNTDRGLPASTTATSYDTDAFSQIGKTGIGGLTISDAGNQLYFVNLTDKKVYGLDISAYNIGGAAPSTYTSFSIPNGCAVGGSNMRPWGIKYHLGKVYVGVVCDGSVSRNRSELRAFVYSLDPLSNTWNTAFNFPLTYPKGPAELFNDISKARNSNNWRTWTDTFTDLIPDGNTLSYNQPILTSIEFDIDNSMILAFADRTGLQGGSRNYGPNAGDTKQYNTISGGELLRVANRNGIYTLEYNGRVGGQQGVFVNNNQGPGLGEFYNDNANFEGPILGYGENTLGGLALRPGSGNVIVSAMSPMNVMSQTFTSEQVNSANGLRRLSNTNGTLQSAYVIYQNASPDYSQNTVGLGDIELGCAAPTFIEIGSRVWTDTDKDGIQDPCEPILAGVNVSLYKAGVLLATTVTSTNGEYFFSSRSKLTGGTWSGTGADTTLLPSTAYQVVFGSGGQFAGGALNISGKYYELTQAFSTAPTASTLNDSNLQLATVAGNNLPTANVTTGALGTVNHAIDGGFVCTTINVATISATPASCTGASANNNGQITLSGVRNAEKAFIYTTSAPSYTATGSQPISASVVSFTGLANPSTSAGQSYSVILYNGPSCFTIVTATLPQNNCNGCTLSLTATPGACSPVNNAFSTSVVIRLASTVTGVLTVADGPNSLTFAATAGTTQSFTAIFNGITANASSHTVTATLPGCATTSATYTAPASCSAPVCSVVTSVQPGACFPATNTFSTIIYVTVQNSIAGTLTINDGAQSQSFATTTSPATYSAVFSGMPSNGSLHIVTATLPGCATSTATYTAPVSCTQPAGAQLTLNKVVDKSRAEAGETITYTMVVSNTGTAAASTIVVRDSISTGLQHIGTPSVPANTTFATGTPISTWTIAGLSAGQSLSLTFQVRADSAGIMYNRATIPGDTAVVCTSVPVIVCTGDQYTFELVAALGRSSYRWYKDGTEIQNNGSNVLLVNSPGSYSLAVDTADPNKCPDFSCCPFIVEEDVLPNYQASAVSASCVNGTAQANGRIVLSGFNPAYKYQYSLGTDFNPAASLSGAPQTIPANGVIASTLANPAMAQTYTIRVYNRGTCYTDVTVTLNPTVCCSVNVVATAGQCVPATNTYSSTATVTLSNVTAGTLTITDGVSSATFVTTTTASATFSAVFANIPANGASHTVVATLPGCSTATTTYTAPVSCSMAPVCSLTAAVTAGACQTASNTYSANVVVNLSNAVAGSVSVTISGAAPVSQTIAANATSLTLIVPNLVSDGAIHSATVSLPNCGSTTATYSAPASCSVAPVCSLTAAVTAGVCQTATNTYSANVLVNLT
ncbi:SdrD B-like domain-containing protein, partial [Spirosoma daeguense]